MPVSVVWSSPLTLIGLACAALLWLCSGGKGRFHWRTPALSFHSPLTDKIFNARLLKLHALCIGQVIIARNAACLAHAWAHECVHVQQSLRYGPLFPLLYCGHSLWCVLTGRHAYWDNVFEVQARAFEQASPMSD